MGTDLAAPETPIVPVHELDLVRQLQSSWNVRLRTNSKTGILDHLVLDGEMSAKDATGALAAIDKANARRAPPTQIAKALAVLTAVCAKPSDFDDAKVVLWSERLKQVLAEFPAEIAMAAVSQWPRTDRGQWWPTEKEIRDQCESHMQFRADLAEMLLRQRAKALAPPKAASDAPAHSDGFSAEPSGACAAYVEEFGTIDPRRTETYLKEARFAADGRIGIRQPLACFTLESAAPGLMKKHGVRVVAPRAFSPYGGVEWAP